jgi:hypothetical protein
LLSSDSIFTKKGDEKFKFFKAIFTCHNRVEKLATCFLQMGNFYYWIVNGYSFKHDAGALLIDNQYCLPNYLNIRNSSLGESNET